LEKIPYYALVKEARIYFLHKGSKPTASPSGYVFAVEVEAQGRRIPFVITVNGPTLSKSDVEAAVRLVADDFGTAQVLLTSFKRSPDTVNTDNARDGMNSFNGSLVAAAFPEGWEIIDRLTKSDLYSRKRLGKARLVAVQNPDPRQIGVTRRWQGTDYKYQGAHRLKNLTVKERVRLAYDLLLTFNALKKRKSELLSLLEI